jgi:hypothetical protein
MLITKLQSILLIVGNNSNSINGDNSNSINGNNSVTYDDNSVTIITNY